MLSPPTLYGHPFSSYCQKALIAFYETGAPFAFRMLDDAEGFAELKGLWPLGRFPVLVDGDATLIEASIIVEHLAIAHPEAGLLPEDCRAALAVRFLDRFFDNYVMAPMQKIVADHRRGEGDHDPAGVAEACATLDEAYRWIDGRVRLWAAGEGFTMADCAAAPSLFYADWVHPIPEHLGHARAYRARLLAHPSVWRAVDEARPYRGFFPPGAPDRD